MKKTKTKVNQVKISRNEIAGVIRENRRIRRFAKFAPYFTIVEWQKFIVGKTIEYFGKKNENLFWKTWANNSQKNRK